MTDISTKDLITLISACKKSGVSKIDWGELRLEFRSSPSGDGQINPIQATEAPELSKRRFEMLEADIRQQQLDELMAMDPEKYEELIAQGELTPPEEPDADEAH